MSHTRNTTAMAESRRCGAKTRAGTPCCAPAVSGKKRCRMHGGAPGSGALLSNQNALKHGEYSTEALLERQALQDLLREAKELLDAMRDVPRPKLQGK